MWTTKFVAWVGVAVTIVPILLKGIWVVIRAVLDALDLMEAPEKISGLAVKVSAPSPTDLFIISIGILCLAYIAWADGLVTRAVAWFHRHGHGRPAPPTATGRHQITARDASRAVAAPTLPIASPQAPELEIKAAGSGSVEWDFQTAGTPQHAADVIYGFNDAHDGGFLVSVFRIIGHNRTSEPITDVRAYVIPQITREKLPLRFVLRDGLVEPEKTYGIPAGAQFSMAYIIPPSDKRNVQGVPLDEYLAKYGGFTFVFEHGDAATFTHRFSFTEVKEMLTTVATQREVARRPAPEVRKRDDQHPERRPKFSMVVSGADISTPSSPPRSSLIILFVTLDNAGEPSIAKEWALNVSVPKRDPQHARHRRIAQHERIPIDGGMKELHGSDTLDHKTENTLVIGRVTGRLAFILEGVPKLETVKSETLFVLSVKDKDGATHTCVTTLAEIAQTVAPQ